MSARYQNGGNLRIKFGGFNKTFNAVAGVWVGARVGVYALSKRKSQGYAKFAYFVVKNKNV